MNFHRTYAVFKTEFLHIGRDRRSLLFAFVLPLLLLFLLSYAVSSDVRSLTLGVFDADGTSESRSFLQAIENTRFFELRAAPTPAELRRWIETGEVKGALWIPADFTDSLLRQMPAPIAIDLDVVHPLSARVYAGYLNAVSAAYPLRMIEGEGTSPLQPRPLEFQTLYNPSFDAFANFVPALIGCILMSLVPVLSAIAIVRERESGSFNRILASPTSPLEFLAGKLSTYFLIALSHCFALALLATLWFKVPFEGSVLEFALLAIVFVLSAVLFGLMISTITDSQMTALIAGLTMTLLPAIIFSGLHFPVRSIPMPIRWVASLVPAQYFVEIVRGIFIKGTHLAQWWPSFTGLCLVTLAIAFLTYIQFTKIAKGPS